MLGVLPVVGPPHAAEDPVRVQRNVAGRVDALLVCFEVFVDRSALGGTKRSVADEFEVHLAAHGHEREGGRVAVAEHGEVPVEVELGDDRVEPQVDFVLLVPGDRVVFELLDGEILLAEESLGKRHA